MQVKVFEENKRRQQLPNLGHLCKARSSAIKLAAHPPGCVRQGQDKKKRFIASGSKVEKSSQYQFLKADASGGGIKAPLNYCKYRDFQ